MAKLRVVPVGLRFDPAPGSLVPGQRYCLECCGPLTGDFLLAQAEVLMRPFAGAPLVGEVLDAVTVMLQRAAGPLHSGSDCCYSCAYALSEPAPNAVQ